LVGIGALTACIGVESLYAVVAARKHYLQLPAASERPLTYRQLWRFGWPVMLMQTAESGVAFVVTFFLGRLPRPELAIAAFGVLDGMIRVLLGPLRNLTPTVQTLTQSRADIRVMGKFAIQVAIVFALTMGVMQVESVRSWALESVMGLPPNIAAYVAPALTLSFVLALCMTASSFFRGLLLSSRKTGAIAVSSVVRIGAAGVVGAVALTMSGVNGAVVGMLCLIATFAVEALILGIRVLQVERREHGLFRSDA
jgi:O-antigen/teichoic acid export membrane protein